LLGLLIRVRSIIIDLGKFLSERLKDNSIGTDTDIDIEIIVLCIGPYCK